MPRMAGGGKAKARPSGRRPSSPVERLDDSRTTVSAFDVRSLHGFKLMKSRPVLRRRRLRQDAEARHRRVALDARRCAPGCLRSSSSSRRCAAATRRRGAARCRRGSPGPPRARSSTAASCRGAPAPSANSASTTSAIAVLRKSTPVTADVAIGRSSAKTRLKWPKNQRERTAAPPLAASGAGACAASAGLRLSALNAEMTTEMAMVSANCWNSRPLMPDDERDGMNTERQHQRDGHHRPGHLAHRLQRRLARRHSLLDVVLHRLDHDDGVVDDEADGEHQPEQRQRVDREAEQRKQDERAEQRHRHRAAAG